MVYQQDMQGGEENMDGIENAYMSEMTDNDLTEDAESDENTSEASMILLWLVNLASYIATTWPEHICIGIYSWQK